MMFSLNGVLSVCNLGVLRSDKALPAMAASSTVVLPESDAFIACPRRIFGQRESNRNRVRRR